MVTGWLLKVVATIAVIGFLIVELGSPLLARGQLDDKAHLAANEAMLALKDGRSAEIAKAKAVEVAGDKLTFFEITGPAGAQSVSVVLEDDAKSYLLRKYIKKLDGWYHIKADATAP